MFSYIKSLVAVGLALLAVVGAGFWVQERMAVLRTLKKDKRDGATRVAEAKGHWVAVSGLEAQMDAIARDTADITEGFVGQNKGGIELVKAVVHAASVSGMKMTGASEVVAKGRTLRIRDVDGRIEAVSYKISLEGTYTGLVKLLKNLASRKLRNRIESLEISAGKDCEATGVIKAELVLSVFSSKT